jgi:hypothetical protein
MKRLLGTGESHVTRTFARIALTITLVSIPLTPFAQNGAPKERKTMTAIRVPNGSVDLDGKLHESLWSSVQMVDDFTQKEPDAGKPATERTQVGFAYDDDAIYIGARMFSNHPESLHTDVNRRDNPGNCEQMIISIDSYLDRRTCYDFGVSVAGVRTDRYHPIDDEFTRVMSYNPVWDAHSSIDSLGWTCEMRIPFSQLRFIDKPDQIWGVNMNRWVPSRNEDAFWIAVPRDETGWSSWFGDLTGISGVKPTRRLELLPYVAGDAKFETGRDDNDPFNDGSDFDGRAGADVKMGLGPNLTLDATVNPDFGQVEADPAEVNLSAFETAFSEKRPFFVEGSQLFEAEGPTYFYSRRVGTRPRGSADGDFVDYPSNATILGAAKVTGRTSKGLSVGVLSAVTSREQARIFDTASGEETKIEVEPATGYGVVRLQQEFGADQSTAGIMLTGLTRDLDDMDPLAGILRKNAVSGNLDWTLRFKGGAYDLYGYAGFSHIEGTKESITRAQRSSARYYQRPDAQYVELDPNATSMSGYTMGMRGGKRSGKHWLWGGGFALESPGFELNDAGILGQADDIESWNHIIYREQTPGKIFRRYEIELSRNSFWNFSAVKGPSNDPSHMLTFAELNIDGTFRNFWNAHYYLGYDWPGKSDNLTRGGPMARQPNGIFTEVSVSNNHTSRVNLSGWVFYFSNDIGGWEQSGGFSVGGRLGNRMSYSVAPRLNREADSRQYIATVVPEAGEVGNPGTYGNRYILGNIYRTQISAQIRVNYFFNPDLSLECYAEPFAASGDYRSFGELRVPASSDLNDYGVDGREIEEVETGVYEVNDGTESFTFSAEDFGVRSFRSNVVLRWEFRPGSTFYLVWQQDRFGFEEPGRKVRLKSLEQAISADGVNFFAVKMSYWIPIS